MPVLAPIAAFAGTSAGAATIGAAATIGGAALSASAQKSAASTAANAAAQSAAAQKALQDQAITTANQVNAPGLQTGFAALDALAARYGLNVSSGGAQSQAAPSYDQYLADNPDLKAEAARVVGNDPRFPTVESYLQWHDANYANEGRQSYLSGPDAGSPEAPNPAGTYTAPQISNAQAPTYRTSADVLSQIGGFRPLDISTNAFKTSGYYKLGLDEGLNAVNAGYNARGLLKSGAAIKGVEDFAQTNFAKNYGNFANTELSRYGAEAGQYNADRSALLNQLNNENQFAFQNYTDQRNYDTSNYDTNTNNLFRLAGIGQNAAGNVTAAAGGYANNVGGIYADQAAAQGQAAYSRANSTSDLAGIVSGQVANLFNNGVKTNGAKPVLSNTTPSSTWTNPYGYF